MHALSLLVVLCSPLPPAIVTEDYLMVFTADAPRYKATMAHTFAVLVRVEQTPGQPPKLIDFVSLSWLPETMKVRALAMRHEKGRNVPLDETLRFYTDAGSHICMWGPYRIQPELAETFRARVVTVESCFHYKGACWTSPRDVCDCARSVEEMVPGHRRYIGVFGYGAAAGSVVVQKFSPWLIEPCETHPFAASLIGLDEFALIRRPFGDFSTRKDQLGSYLRGK